MRFTLTLQNTRHAFANLVVDALDALDDGSERFNACRLRHPNVAEAEIVMDADNEASAKARIVEACRARAAELRAQRRKDTEIVDCTPPMDPILTACADLCATPRQP
jgi:DNA-directed RNA polymerase subunit L